MDHASNPQPIVSNGSSFTLTMPNVEAVIYSSKTDPITDPITEHTNRTTTSKNGATTTTKSGTNENTKSTTNGTTNTSENGSENELENELENGSENGSGNRSENEITTNGTHPSIHYSITAPFDYLHNIPSNNHNIRLSLLHAFNEAFFRVQDPRVLGEIGHVVATLHEASLLIDDIEDESDMRRGRPAAHTHFGHALTINSANYMYFLACQNAANNLSKLTSPEAINSTISISNSDHAIPKTMSNSNSNSTHSTDSNFIHSLFLKDRVWSILMDEMLRIHMGQGQDLHWRVNLAQLCSHAVPSPEEYLKMAMDKTGGLLRLSVELLVVFSENPPNHPLNTHATALANLIGIIYQVRDDYLNLVDPRYTKMKGFAGEDLAEGKLSLPVLFALSCSPDSPVHRLLLGLRTSEARLSSPDMLSSALKYIKSCGALEFSYQMIQEYAKRGEEMVVESGLENGHKLYKILVNLADVVKPDSTMIV